MAALRNIEYLRTARVEGAPAFGTKLAESLGDITQRVSNIEQQTNTNQSGAPPVPPQIDSLSVMAQDGIFDAKINDSSNVYRGVEYFLEHSTTPNFSQPHVIHLGTTRNWRGYLGNLGLHFRAYSGYSTGASSAHVYHGSAAQPLLVQGGGVSGPALQSSSGAGTALNDGTQGGHGYGPVQYRSQDGKAPIR